MIYFTISVKLPEGFSKVFNTSVIKLVNYSFSLGLMLRMISLESMGSTLINIVTTFSSSASWIEKLGFKCSSNFIFKASYSSEVRVFPVAKGFTDFILS